MSALGELAGLFLKLGSTAFGGPAAHVAMLEAEVVRRRRWLTLEQFLDLLGATNLIPGPNSTEMAIHIGYLRAGYPGLIVAGTCFVLPAVLIVIGLAWAYQTFGSLPPVAGLLYGVKPVIIAIVAQALWGFLRSTVKGGFHAMLAVAAAALSGLGMHELVLLLVGGWVAVIHLWVTRRALPRAAKILALGLCVLPRSAARAAAATASATVGGAATASAFGLWPMFLFFLKVGSVLYGSGYVLLAFLRADLVERWQWLSEGQLLDAVAVGQFTPGPLFTTATFIGYLLGGLPGAVLGTVGIFLPAFVFVALSVPLIPRLRRHPSVGAFLDGVIVASLALMAVVTWHLGRAALVDVPTICLAVLSLVLVLRFRVNSAWLVLGGAAVGLALVLLGLR